MKTKALISCAVTAQLICAFIFAYANSWCTDAATGVFAEVGEDGEMLLIHNITRYCGGLYECEAQNGIGTGVHRSINVDVECKVILK